MEESGLPSKGAIGRWSFDVSSLDEYTDELFQVFLYLHALVFCVSLGDRNYIQMTRLVWTFDGSSVLSFSWFDHA